MWHKTNWEQIEIHDLILIKHSRIGCFKEIRKLYVVLCKNKMIKLVDLKKKRILAFESKLWLDEFLVGGNLYRFEQ